MLNKTEAKNIAHEIGRDLRDGGRHSSDLGRWATAYSYYQDIVAALTPAEVGKALHGGWAERDGELFGED